MSVTLMILSATATLGAIDVLYYHLYRFRLFAQPGSVAEEVTHLARHLIFLAAVALLSSGSSSPLVDRAILTLLVADMLNTTLDVILERRSRAPLGGLPTGEYLIHIAGTFGTGLTTAAYLFERRTLPLPAPEGPFAWQITTTLIVGAALFTLESTLFLQALARRWGRTPAPATA